MALKSCLSDKKTARTRSHRPQWVRCGFRTKVEHGPVKIWSSDLSRYSLLDNPRDGLYPPNLQGMAQNMSKYSRNSKTIITILPIIALLIAIPVTNVVASNQSSKNFAELVWGDGTLWSMVAPIHAPFPHPGASQGQEDFYEEAPQVPGLGFPESYQSNDCSHLGIIPGTNSTTCHHDHTLGSVPGDTGFRALWHVFLVVCGDNVVSVVYDSLNSCTSETVTGTPFPPGPTTLTLYLAKIVTIGGTPTPLTSEAAINSAVNAGLVTEIDTGVTFICPVQAYRG